MRPLSESIHIPDHSDQEWQIDNLPNRLTIIRVLLIPVIIGALYITLFDIPWVTPYERLLGYFAAVVFIVASVTDFLDGFIARRRQIVTVFGSFLDPIADKFLVVSSLIILQEMGRIPVIIVIILVLREMYITALRLMAMERGISVPVGALGKWKTTFQMIAIPLLMAYDTIGQISMALLGSIFIYLASLFSLYSAGQYSLGLLRKIKHLKKQKKKKKPPLSEGV